MLQKVSIQNFKSLKDVTLELQKVNLLIGPNNSGKSNFLKALEFLKLLSLNEPPTTNYFQTITKIDDFFGKSKTSKMSFGCTLAEEEEYNMLISIEDGKYEAFNGERYETLFGIHHSDANKHAFWSEDKVINNPPRLITMDGFPIQYFFKDFFNNLSIYKPDPNKLQNPFPILPNQSIVNSDASNLVAFLDILQGRYRDNFVAIENDLNKCIPEFSRIELDPVEITKDDDLFKIYRDKTFKRLGLYDKNNKLTYWADELSEGTLYFLALLCIVHQPNPPKLLLLEEPEKGIHPRRIKEVIDFIFQLVEDKDIQVIMTTHSERVLDEFEDIPEAVFIFDKDEEGATQVKNLLREVIEPSDKLMEENNLPKIKFTKSLSSHWVTGFMGGVPR
ncbi:MAG: AAA family ATPase [Bacteriovorax sp.]|nr:AAA family ATPase [Bacteriovorax sp.]